VDGGVKQRHVRLGAFASAQQQRRAVRSAVPSQGHDQSSEQGDEGREELFQRVVLPLTQGQHSHDQFVDVIVR